ncbi:uncharacterized protein Tco025E_00245 [Trypanosoma conorhini]|uniref:Uncharacterized protein n=1 Tax=Trypanosoma conorhini TaxID=83891 RepID=A0A3R7SBA2_9TRYP|nr:uncharacterized protein Tco025E_00245 [Trypanosoma conorhini]RNF27509.1 hypothetical protein Tco025E_00245 [Trypanosoma conorhini]
MSRQGVSLSEGLGSEAVQSRSSRPDSRGARRRPSTASVTSSIGFSVASGDGRSNRKTRAGPASTPVSFLTPKNESLHFSPKRGRLKPTGSQTSVYSNSVCSSVESPLQRRLNSVRMKVGLAEAILQNASNTAKAPMSPARRRRHMVQLEVAKLILFAARQQNVREEMQRLGHPLDESDTIMYHRRSIVSDIPFLARESPPDVSLDELKRVTFVMEQQLAEAKATKPQPPPSISADRVSSNMSELLWLIESMELQGPCAQYANLGDDSSSPNATSTSAVVAAMTETLQLRQEEQQPAHQQKQRESFSQLRTPESSLKATGESFSPSLVAPGTNLLELTRLSGDMTTVQGQEDTKADELVGFSVEVESPGCRAVEAAGLKLLQFMYDAIDASEEEFQLMKEKDAGAEAAAEARRKTQDGQEILPCLSAAGTDVREAHRFSTLRDSTARNSDMVQQLQSATSRDPGTLATAPAEESEDQALTQGTTNFGQESSSSRRQSAGFEVPATNSWLEPAHPAVEVRPLRVDLFEILQQLYYSFNYNYYFRQCKEKKQSKRQKTQEEYSEEVARLLAEKKNARQQHGNDSLNDEAALLSTWQVKTSARTPTPRSQKSIGTALEVTAELLEKSSMTAVTEVAPPEVPREEAAVPTESVGAYDESIVFSMEIGKGILFLLKGRGQRRGVTGSLSSTTGKKKTKKKGPKKQGTAADKEASDTTEDATAKEKSRLDFESYTLYAINQSDTPQQATVETNVSKLKNLKIKSLLNYLVKNKTIAVDLPPFGTQSVLTLNPIKKGREVVFDGALNFHEGAPVKEEPQAKGVMDKKHSSRLPSVSRPSKITPSAASKASKESLDNSVETQLKERLLAQSEQGEKEAVTEEDELPEEAAGATEPPVQGNKTADQKQDTAVGIRRELSRQKFNPLLLRPIKGTEDLESGMNSPAGSSLSGDNVVMNKVNEWGVSVIPVEGDLGEQQEEARRRKSAMNATQTRPKEAATTVKGRASITTKEPTKGGETGPEIRKGRVSEAASDLAGVTRVGEWGVAHPNEDDEAFENNCVVLSVLQASEWQAPSTSWRRPSEKSPFLPKVVSGETKATNEAEKALAGRGRGSVEGATPAYSASSSASQRYPSARLRPRGSTEEELIAAVLHSAGQEESSQADEFVAGILNRIADEELLGTDRQLEKDGFSVSKQSDETPLRAGSAALWRHQSVSQSQQGRASLEPQGEVKEQLSPATPGYGAAFPLGSFTEAQKLRSISASAALQDSVDSKERAFINRAVFPEKVSSGNFSAAVDFSQQPSVELVRESSAQPVALDGRFSSFAAMGESSVPVYYCEECLAAHPHDHAVSPTPDAIKAREDARTPTEIASLVERRSRMESKGAISVAELLRAKSAVSATREDAAFNVNALLAGVSKAKKSETPPPGPPSRHSAWDYEIPPQERPATPTRQYAYTDVRPGGRVAILVPEAMDTVGPTPLLSSMQKGKTEGKSLQAEGVAEEIRISLHSFARQARSHSNRIPISQSTNTTATATAAVTKNTKFDGMRYAELPPLSALYSHEVAQEVEDLEAGEEEAKALFMQDPARYDCVVDELIKRATMRVQEEEKREKVRRETVTRVMGDSKLDERLVVASNRRQSHAITHRQVSVTELQFGGSFPIGTSSGSTGPSAREVGGVSQAWSLTNESLLSLPSGKQHGDTMKSGVTNGFDQILEEQRRAKKIVAYILMEMRRMWRRRELESNLALRSAVDRFIYRSVLFSWHFERRRVLNLQKLIQLLDRKTGRVGGWIPFYVRDRVMEERFVWEPAPPHLSRQLRVVHRAMCLAKQQRMYPLRIVRQQARKEASHHLLYGYKRTFVGPFTTSAVRLRQGRRSRYAAPFQRPILRFSPQLEWRDGTPRK